MIVTELPPLCTEPHAEGGVCFSQLDADGNCTRPHVHAN